MDYASLAGKSRDELAKIALDLKIKVHHKAKPETILYQIMQQPQSVITNAVENPVLEKPPARINTKDEVLHALKAYVGKEGYKIEFNDEENTVHLSYKGACECINLTTLLNVILQKASTVARGARGPIALGKEGNTGKYTDNILHAQI